MAFDEDWDAPREYFDAYEACDHLLVIRAFDAPKGFRSENNKDGLVYPRDGGEPFPNTVVRCAVADLDATEGPAVYPEAVLFPFSITKVAKMWVGKGPQLVMWRKGKKQTDPYELFNMRNDEQAVKAGIDFLEKHPEFLELPAPEPYETRLPQPRDRDEGPRDRDEGPRDNYSRERSNGWGDADRGRDTRVVRRRDEGEWDRRPPQRDEWDERPRYNGGGRGGGARDWGQHDEQPRRRAYEEDTWARQRPGQGPGGSYNRDDRDGSFLSRSRNHHGDPQSDEDIPF